MTTSLADMDALRGPAVAAIAEQHLAALHLFLITPAVRARPRTRAGTDVRPAVSPEQVIGYLREHEITVTWDPAAAAVQARATETAKTATVKTN